MAVAAPAMAMSARLAAAFALMAATPSLAQETRCAPPLPELRSGNGRIFAAQVYSRTAWRQRASGGQRLEYAMHAWRGKVAGRDAYLTFDEIPGTSGPNYHMDYKLKRVPAQPVWHVQGSRFAFDRRFAVYTGPLAGEWSVANCAAR